MRTNTIVPENGSSRNPRLHKRSASGALAAAGFSDLNEETETNIY